MSKKLDCAIFQDLYELYEDGDLEPETMEWLKEHEQACGHCLREEWKDSIEVETSMEDHEKIKSIRILTMIS